MTSVQPVLHSAPPHDLLHTVALGADLPMACWSWPQGQCLWVTPAGAALWGQSATALPGQTLHSLLAPQDGAQWHAALSALVAQQAHGASAQALLMFAQQRWACRLVALHSPAGEASVVVLPQSPAPQALVQDCRKRPQAQAWQLGSALRLRRYAEVTQEAVVFFRGQHMLDASPAAVALMGYPLHQLQGRPVAQLFPAALEAQLQHWLHSGMCGSYETQLHHHHGHAVQVALRISVLADEVEPVGMLVLRDLSERQRTQAQLQFLQQHDPLTRLLNRQSLLQQLRQQLHQAQHSQAALAVLCVDVDQFKAVNDSLGHAAGDAVLQQMAQRLQSMVGPQGRVARWAADEFVVVLGAASGLGQLQCQAQTLRQQLGQPYGLPSGALHLSASMGVSLFPEDGSDADTLLLNASAAMVAAKKNGQGTVQYYSALLDRRHSRWLDQDRLLREAIASNQGLLLHYQPQWNLQTQRLEGFEALVRWQHPEKGMLPPAEFIAFAEARGLIGMLDRWVMREACRQLRAWQDAGLPAVSVSVNLSAVEFSQHHLAQEVEQLLQEAGVLPQWLEIELTESSLIKPSEQVCHTMRALKQLGVRLSVDDFGTGYSSLAYLKRYPLDKLKIDRSFIQDLPDDGGDRHLVTAMIQMARSLQLLTVAEGVETQAQWELLQALGCDLSQGYYLAHPMPAQEATRWLEKHGTALGAPSL